ncbi:DHH family phosphoesterase [Candidatus Saccharibacteria bacterium]|nr:DHH family phosphoesterase [Candidatus Saccharibacteria bacterium]HPW48196.1 DHH family phosphoesterase [Candidatus Saccharibacteria bacterium]
MTELTKIEELVKKSNHILVIQADNPDGDSLGSALALEQILSDLGKTVSLYCGVEIPSYIRFLKGWDRVSKQLPHKIDSSIIVDTSARMLLTQMDSDPESVIVYAKPIIVLDHHENVKCDIPNAQIVYNRSGFVSTGELIYELAKTLKWPMNLEALENITQSILSDSLGLTSDAASPKTYRRLADILEKGVSRAKLEEDRRALSKMAPSVFQFKAQLIERTEFYGDKNEIGIVSIPEEELYTVGTLYNPAPLILNEITMVEGVKVGIVLKRYKDKVTGAIRCAEGCHIAHELAECFGGGGHPYAAGFKKLDTSINFGELKCQVLKKAQELIAKQCHD